MNHTMQNHPCHLEFIGIAGSLGFLPNHSRADQDFAVIGAVAEGKNIGRFVSIPVDTVKLSGLVFVYFNHADFARNIFAYRLRQDRFNFSQKGDDCQVIVRIFSPQH